MGYYTKHHPCDGCDKPILGNSSICIECARRNYAAGLQDVNSGLQNVASSADLVVDLPSPRTLRKSFFNPKDSDIFKNMLKDVMYEDIDWNDIFLFIETVYSLHLDGKYDLEASVV